jgi:hypothetical protein
MIKTLDEVDFRPSENSKAIDNGATYFIPWSLYGTVGEWHFTENNADPERIVDYAWFQSRAHFHRMFYEHVPPLDLVLNSKDIGAYVDAQLEDWCKGGLVFDGKRFGKVSDAAMRADIEIPVYRINKKGETVKIKGWPDAPWETPEPVSGKGRKAKYAEDAVISYPAKLRNTLIITDQNMLVEAYFKTEDGFENGMLLGKHDGHTGYRLYINAVGQVEFEIAANGQDASIESLSMVNDGKWHHVLAEVDRTRGVMRMYLDGKITGPSQSAIPATLSLDNRADFLVGKASDDSMHFKGVVDFMRVCQGTLADAQTDIDELYEWQMNGPAKYDMTGKAPMGAGRDAGALELK